MFHLLEYFLIKIIAKKEENFNRGGLIQSGFKLEQLEKGRKVVDPVNSQVYDGN
jgi:hypothetical protein